VIADFSIDKRLLVDARKQRGGFSWKSEKLISLDVSGFYLKAPLPCDQVFASGKENKFIVAELSLRDASHSEKGNCDRIYIETLPIKMVSSSLTPLEC
jgi:hypothetical protein